jgi:hypothetical protein
MSYLALITIIDGLIGLTIRLVDGVREDPSTPEELAMRLTELRSRLAETHGLVMTWKPLP